MKPVKIVMAGLAHAHGTGFLKSALRRENVSILGFFDADNPENARAASLEFGAPVYDSLEELFSLGANTLLTARINSEKPEYIIRALEHGIGVIADKPMVTTESDLDAIEAAAGRTGAPLYLLLTERFSPAMYTAKKLIDSGAVGSIVQQYLVRPHRLRPENRPEWMMYHPECYGGIINDIGVHDFDLARWFSGCEAESVLGASVSCAKNTSYPGFEDNGMALVRMENGGSACVSVNWLTPDAYPAHGDTRFFLIGTHGAVDILSVENKVRWYSDSVPETWADILTPPCDCVDDALETMADPEHHIPVISTEDSVRSTRIALAAEAAAHGKTLRLK